MSSIIIFFGFLIIVISESLCQDYITIEIPINKMELIGDSVNLSTLDDKNFEKVELLHFTFSTVTGFKKNLHKFVSLWEVEFHASYGFEEFLEAIPDSNEIRVFSIQNCIFVDINKIIEKLPNLETLEIINTRFTGIPSSISTLKKLKWISFVNNYFNKLPNEIWELKELYYLRISENYIDSIETFLEKIPIDNSIYELDLECVDGLRITDSFKNLDTNCSINLSRNHVEDLEKLIFLGEYGSVYLDEDFFTKEEKEKIDKYFRSNNKEKLLRWY